MGLELFKQTKSRVKSITPMGINEGILKGCCCLGTQFMLRDPDIAIFHRGFLSFILCCCCICFMQDFCSHSQKPLVGRRKYQPQMDIPKYSGIYFVGKHLSFGDSAYPNDLIIFIVPFEWS